ncbi:Crp/Fnr family transcriptional regulator [Aetokthonos hydrillicola Thurmond2011]|jgi:CRP-like cAMP-binding protein|uniref:Crp/Fnr family transcriptional regulator n=1 Tax=Aetokthonos hydrillicola Thurmond2011 TaxID=2712845 RepID=A0AAP5IGC1_9CYAN|nr:Crp/Fnr family transcriptional regulator [Aetokthonos hydrillicola]MBO3462628.1 Crp/Fnr family transcriptional regulator [Aetokthonos hydrillicola CCALA 1050]MBW4585760.1 Crp/Fnr family transcriptional regulator [Aetokthonos hydrillicola CCALA 1050]MDR9899263.1 Crp/Fnr family transcriptional regulator [Aetokthonos hydrillicola Thurmond2011]
MRSFKLEELPAYLHNAIAYRNLAEGEILFRQNEPVHAIFAVDFGCIKLLHFSDAGKIINHYSVKPGQYFAEVALFNEIYVCTAVAEIKTKVISFPKQLFLKALEEDINLSKSFTEQLARRLHYTKLLLELRGIRSARDRVLHYLRVITPPNEKIVDLEHPLKDIATDIGIAPEVLSRTLTKLQNDGVITRIKRKIIFQS